MRRVYAFLVVIGAICLAVGIAIRRYDLAIVGGVMIAVVILLDRVLQLR